ncbi:MAG TPA: 3-octaprenyl-4-hydroxybenzoate carboxy-lyase [Bacteroidales bacterium]|nr:MAG: 3-octaprenyl-4-hydroxybenzoate carboxy-lyase [Bacteroidetes bacterium GWF2_33_38]OFY75174.1 MAG: 3-octaprenyl-4-hydroxybenzoate carboxy-lyase [Bacteroidetes bacterium RIFOXYA12_FULL_33_9]OFY88968.1 MAG: 3-octaprenyl-4-hydroxybenzoate carboxy-lyase [Bacteroidetes bacterium RIFOXYA2_FULL_33_7]HBF88976.1 3-octaprenyl-4-hydroxybenzoate carboxy-lyase [Bacteroidales bacterium]
MKNKKKIIVGITGASGAIYADLLLKKMFTLSEQIEKVGIVFSTNAKDIWQEELGENYPKSDLFIEYSDKDFYAPFASGSSKFDAMIICPCSMGTLGRIASGVSDGLITRAADVMLKERRKLILVTRETPLSLIHINNMKLVTEAGGIICPANPSFYSKPTTIDELASTVVNRIIDLIGLENKAFRWQEKA